MVESGIFVICPLEYLAEMLGLSQDHIAAKLGNIHGMISLNSWTKVSVQKAYGITNDNLIYNEIEIKSVRNTMSDTPVEIVRKMNDDELTIDEYMHTQKSRIELLDNFKDKIKVFSEISNEHTEMIKKRTQLNIENKNTY